MIDTHCHLNAPEFDADRETVLARERAAGVAACIIPGWDLASSRRAVELAEAHEDLWAAVGVHPHSSDEYSDAVGSGLRALCDHPRVVAVGESGLDFFKNYAPREAQLHSLRAHLALAEETGLPIILHQREADRDLLSVMQEHPTVRGVWHAFDGDDALAAAVMARGDVVGLGGVLTFAKATERRRVAATLPADRFLLETDSPWLTPAPHRGKRNEPAYVALVAQALAAVRGISVEQVTSAATENTRRVFPRLRFPKATPPTTGENH